MCMSTFRDAKIKHSERTECSSAVNHKFSDKISHNTVIAK